MKNDVIALIPAAGLGTRAGVSPTQSKELIIDPDTNKPLISRHLELCKKYGLKPLVVLRAQKYDLRTYCIKNSIDYIIITPEGEWCRSLLQVEHRWGEKNILLLPDTKFSDENVLLNIKKSLENNNLVVARHWVTDGNKWGMLYNNFRKMVIKEKPKDLQTGWAWGIIGFNKEEGKALLTSLEQNKMYECKELKTYNLRWFKDVTR